MPRAAALLLTLLASAATVLALSGPAAAAKPCWKQVVDDWSLDGTIDGAYPARCIDEALAKVPEDIRAYSDFEEQAKAARVSAGRRLQSVGGGSANGASPDMEETQRIKDRDPSANAKDETPVGWALRSGNNADSFPLPLLILLGLAGALLTAGAAGFGYRKLQARRPAP